MKNYGDGDDDDFDSLKLLHTLDRWGSRSELPMQSSYKNKKNIKRGKTRKNEEKRGKTRKNFYCLLCQCCLLASWPHISTLPTMIYNAKV